MNRLSRVEQPKNCDYVGWQTYGRIVKGMSWAGGLGRCKEAELQCKLRIEKMAKAAENAFADRTILLDENLLLFEQNNKKTTRNSIKATVVGSARL